MSLQKKIILFDIDNCLSDSERRRKYIVSGISSICNVDIETAEKLYAYGLRYCKDEEKLGGIDPSIFGFFIAGLVKDKDVGQKIKRLLTGINHDKYILQGVREALKQLNERYILGIQSDGVESYQLAKIQSLQNFFSSTPRKFIIFSHNKIDEIPEKFGDKKEEIIVIDDRPEYVRKLLDLGFEAYLVNYGKHAARNNKLKKPVDDDHIVSNLMNFVNKLSK